MLKRLQEWIRMKGALSVLFGLLLILGCVVAMPACSFVEEALSQKETQKKSKKSKKKTKNKSKKSKKSKKKAKKKSKKSKKKTKKLTVAHTVEVGNPWHTVLIDVKTTSKTAISLAVRQDKSYSAKTIEKQTKSDSKGRARITLSQVEGGTYKGELVVKRRTKSGGVEKKVSAIKFEVQGYQDVLTITSPKPAAKGTRHLKHPCSFKFSGDDKLSANAQTGYFSKTLELDFDNSSQTAQVTIGLKGGKDVTFHTQTAKFKGDRAALEFSLAAFTSKAKVKDLRASKPTIELPMVFTFEGGSVGGNVSCNLSSLLWPISQGKAFTLAGDPGPGGRSVVYALYSSKPVEWVMGGERPLNSLDYVVDMEYKTRALSTCTYVDRRDNSRISVTREANDRQVNIIDRRTGRKVRSKLLRAPTPRCPKEVLTTTTEISEWVSDEALDNYIKSAVARLK